MNARERLRAARPGETALRERIRALDDAPVAQLGWRPKYTWRIAPAFAEGCHAALAIDRPWEMAGDQRQFFELRFATSVPDDVHVLGTGDHGALVYAEPYEFGASIARVVASGFRLSWPAVQWLHAALQLEAPDHRGTTWPQTEPLRLALLAPSEWGTGRPHRSAGFAFSELRGRPPPAMAAEVLALGAPPDGKIAALLADPDPAAIEILRDLVLQRGAPIEAVLRQRLAVAELPELPCEDAPGIDDEFAALWLRVIALDPMIGPP